MIAIYDNINVIIKIISFITGSSKHIQHIIIQLYIIKPFEWIILGYIKNNYKKYFSNRMKLKNMFYIMWKE